MKRNLYLWKFPINSLLLPNTLTKGEDKQIWHDVRNFQLFFRRLRSILQIIYIYIYVYIGNFPKTFVTFWHCVPVLGNLQHKKEQTTSYHIVFWPFFFFGLILRSILLFTLFFSLAFLSVFYTPFWPARRALAFSNVKSSYTILSILSIYFTTYIIFQFLFLHIT